MPLCLIVFFQNMLATHFLNDLFDWLYWLRKWKHIFSHFSHLFRVCLLMLRGGNNYDHHFVIHGWKWWSFSENLYFFAFTEKLELGKYLAKTLSISGALFSVNLLVFSYNGRWESAVMCEMYSFLDSCVTNAVNLMDFQKHRPRLATELGIFSNPCNRNDDVTTPPPLGGRCFWEGFFIWFRLWL